jgi:hypothetical protein
VVRRRLPLVFPSDGKLRLQFQCAFLLFTHDVSCLHMHYVSACIIFLTVRLVIGHANFTCSHKPFHALSCDMLQARQCHVSDCCSLLFSSQLCLLLGHITAHAFYMVSGTHLLRACHMLQARQYIILSVTVSHRNHDIDPDFFIAVLGVLVRYTTGVFSDTSNIVTDASSTRLWALVSLERGLTSNLLHIQGAGLVRFQLSHMPIISNTKGSSVFSEL